MKRKALFEFEDQSWFPAVLRNGMTQLIRVLHRMIGTAEVLEQQLTDCQNKVAFRQVVDLGSGSGGPLPDVFRKINAKRSVPLSLLLTDKYPNPKVVAQFNSQNIAYIRYASQSMDALALEQFPEGLKTMIASFHHLSPSKAKALLKAAVQHKEPILIHEIAANNIPFWLWLLLLPLSLCILVLMALFMTPFVRPLSVSQLFFTYPLPLIPLAYAWDGQASLMRTYSLSDLESMIAQIPSHGYRWEIQALKNSSRRKAGYSVFGYPRRAD